LIPFAAHLCARSGGEILADQLLTQGVSTIYGVPGESFLPVLDALVDRPALRFVNARHEGGAAMMAEAHGKVTGRPGVCLVTRGPGATNASSGVHVAFQDSTPMVLLIGQVARGTMEREAFQEIDYRRMFGPLVKWVAEIDSAARIPEFLSRAFYTALSGRPGPVVLALPEDMLGELATVADVAACRVPEIAPPAEAVVEVLDRVGRAERPVMIVGGGGWTEKARIDLEAYADAASLPVGASFRCQDYIDNTHACYVGHVGIGINPALAAHIREADLVVAVGARLGEMTTSGYTLFDVPRMRPAFVHIHADPEEIGRVYTPDLGVVASSPAMLRALRSTVSRRSPREWTTRLRRTYEGHAKATPGSGSVDLGSIVTWLDTRLPDDAIVCNGAGNYTVWVHRFRRYRRYRTALAPTAGSMGYGLPAAIAAKLAHPERIVVAFAGDGCFQMTGLEFATAAHYRLPIVVIVCNNTSYGTIRMHQERHYPTRVSGTDLRNPDFAALARACGGTGVTVERTEAFAEAFESALSADGPALIEIKTDVEALTPSQSLSQIREAALNAAS